MPKFDRLREVADALRDAAAECKAAGLALARAADPEARRAASVRHDAAYRQLAALRRRFLETVRGFSAWPEGVTE
jgi:hypothetical protein